MPYQELIPILRRALKDIWERGAQMESTWTGEILGARSKEHKPANPAVVESRPTVRNRNLRSCSILTLSKQGKKPSPARTPARQQNALISSPSTPRLPPPKRQPATPKGQKPSSEYSTSLRTSLPTSNSDAPNQTPQPPKKSLLPNELADRWPPSRGKRMMPVHDSSKEREACRTADDDAVERWILGMDVIDYAAGAPYISLSPGRSTNTSANRRPPSPKGDKTRAGSSARIKKQVPKPKTPIRPIPSSDSPEDERSYHS